MTVKCWLRLYEIFEKRDYKYLDTTMTLKMYKANIHIIYYSKLLNFLLLLNILFVCIYKYSATSYSCTAIISLTFVLICTFQLSMCLKTYK